MVTARIKAPAAIRLSRTNSEPLTALLAVVVLLVSPLILVSVSANDSDATVDALVEDLSLEAIMNKYVICFWTNIG